MLIGFVAGLMYLGKAWRLKRKRLPSGGLSLPSLEWLQWANSRAIFVAVAMLGVGIISGVVLNQINISNPSARLALTDPVVISTWLMFFWLLGTVALVAWHRRERQGRKVAYLTLASFVFLAIVLAVGLLMQTKHWGRETKGEGRKNSGAWRVESGACELAGMRSPYLRIRNPQSPIDTSLFSLLFPPSSFALLRPPAAFSPGGPPC